MLEKGSVTMKHLFFILLISFIFTPCLSAFYVRNEADLYIVVTTSTSPVKTYVLGPTKSVPLQKKDYPVTIKYRAYAEPTLKIQTAGCDTISGGQFSDPKPLHHVNWCPNRK